MPRPSASRVVFDRDAHHRPVRHQTIAPRLVLAFACLLLGSSPGLAQDLAEDSPPAPVQEIPIGGSGLDLSSLPLDDPFTYELALFDPHFIESRRFAKDPSQDNRGSFLNRVVMDHQNYYDLHSFRLLASGFIVGAATANTQLDQQLHKHFQVSVRGATSDDWSEFLHADKELGNGRYTLPVFATAWAAGAYFDESPLLVTTGRWGERSIRTFLVGAPPLILAQRLTGGSRPYENDRSSRWLPLQDNNGVSGHAFMASLPFISAAKMTDNRWLKTTFYAGSLLGPLSRVNDGAHYPSQVALGWWMAFVAATAIDRSESDNDHVRIYPYMANGGYGGMLEFEF